jgi:hypothetical protein
MTTIEALQELLLIKYPQLNNVSSDPVQIALFIVDAVNMLSPYQDKWGVLFDSGVLLLSAHLLTRNTSGESNSGTVIESGDDSNKTKYLTPSTKYFGILGTTKYGIEFQALEERVNLNWDKTNSEFEIGYFVQ